MSAVTVNETYYAQLIVTDKTVTPEITSPVDPGSLSASVTLDGAPYTETSVVFTATSEIGIYRMSLDCDGVAPGKTLLITGSYLVNGVRYAFADDVFIDSGASIKDIAEADQRFLLDDGIYKLVVYRRGTSVEILDRKNIKQLGGTDMTNPATQILGGFQEPE